MKDAVRRLLEAHVRHELGRFRGRRFRESVEEEVAALLDWLQGVKLGDVLSPEQVIGVIRRNVVELPVAGGVTELAGEMSRQVLASPANGETLLEDIFTRKQFYKFVDKVAGMEKARKRRIYLALHTPAYSRLISDAVYAVVKEYLLAENPLVQKMPGAAILMTAAKQTVEKTAPYLALQIESRVKELIEARIEKAVRENERFLLSFLDENRLAEVSDAVWEKISKVPLSEHFSTIDGDDMEDFIVLGYEFWMHFRGTPYFEKVYTEIVHAFFDKYGGRELDVLIEDVGVSREMIVREILLVLGPAAKLALASGFLEGRIRARLESFYRSKQAVSLLKGTATAAGARRTGSR